jgi:dTDP-4-amino-4,6-dideoxygalactose transaminase
MAGEGGMLVINDERFIKRAEIIREKGTNRSAFFRGEIDKYGWVDIGSSFLPSDIIAAFLYAQLECIDSIQEKRKAIWNRYHTQLAPLEKQGKIQLPRIPSYAANNAHMYYIVCKNLEERIRLIEHLKKHTIAAVFHYLSLHKSPFYKDKYKGPELIHSDHFSDALLRLPLFVELEKEQQQFVIDKITEFYQ